MCLAKPSGVLMSTDYTVTICLIDFVWKQGSQLLKLILLGVTCLSYMQRCLDYTSETSLPFLALLS